MKHKIIILVVMFALFAPCVSEAFGQAKKTTTSQSSSKSSKKSTKGKKGKKGAKSKKEPIPEMELPYNSNDCLFAIDLKADIPFGPAQAPKGGGRIMEIQRDSKNPHVFEVEHNTVWYKFVAPYTGQLYLEITPTDPKDDYDFLVYKYTNQYFTNNLTAGKIKPIVSNLSLPDSVAKGCTGISDKGTKKYVSKNDTMPYSQPFEVKLGEVYYIVLDHPAYEGKGHTIKAHIHVESIEPKVIVYDDKQKKSIPVELLLIEKNTDNRVVLKDNNFKNGKFKLVPKFNYALYVKKDGYFSVYRDFNANIFLEDTLLRIKMNKIEKGVKFQLSEVYFEEAGTVLMKESDSLLMIYVQKFLNHPEVSFNIKGYVNTYGFDVDADMKNSLERATAVQEFFIKNGINKNRITVSGMSKSDIRKTTNENMKDGKPNTVKIEITITDIVKKP
jgi:outer membrane protein OmpA-like peptidoglycan-associated protein